MLSICCWLGWRLPEVLYCFVLFLRSVLQSFNFSSLFFLTFLLDFFFFRYTIFYLQNVFTHYWPFDTSLHPKFFHIQYLSSFLILSPVRPWIWLSQATVSVSYMILGWGWAGVIYFYVMNSCSLPQTACVVYD